MKISDQNERDGGMSQGGHMTNLDLQKHMVFHIWHMALTFRQVNYPAIAFTSSQLISLDPQVSKYGSFRGVLFRSKCGKISEYFYRGLIRSMELTIGFTNRALDRSS